MTGSTEARNSSNLHFQSAADLLVWLPHSYTTSGPAESCIRLVEGMARSGPSANIHLVRARKPVPEGVRYERALPRIMRDMPFGMVGHLGRKRLTQQFARAISIAAPGSIAWFWPQSDPALVKLAKERGLVTVREMINSPLAHAKPVLDAAYRDADLDPAHGITGPAVAQENEELQLYDYIFSSNAIVDQALQAVGVPTARILKSSFGWSRDRISDSTGDGNARPRGFRAAFVGLINVRKGIPTLLAAWQQAGIDGELVLAGAVEPCLGPLLKHHCATGRVRHLGNVSDVSRLYRSCDAFVFPTHEEGGPQVTYEAAACGLPVITTEMGAARLVRDGETGLIVPPGNASALAQAIRHLAEDKTLRQSIASAAQSNAAAFEYREVGRMRGELLAGCTTPEAGQQGEPG